MIPAAYHKSRVGGKTQQRLSITTKHRTTALPQLPEHFLTSLLSGKIASLRICRLPSPSPSPAILITVLPLKFWLTQEIRASIIRASSDFRTFGARNGRIGSAEDGGGGVAEDDRRCCRSLCEQQYVAHRATGRNH